MKLIHEFEELPEDRRPRTKGARRARIARRCIAQLPLLLVPSFKIEMHAGLGRDGLRRSLSGRQPHAALPRLLNERKPKHLFFGF